MSAAYVIIKPQGQAHTRLGLPVVVGADPRADIYVQSDTFTEPVVILSDGSELKAKRLSSGADFAMENFATINLKLIGPVVSRNSKPEKILAEGLAWEKVLLKRLPSTLQLILGAKLSQTRRLSIQGLVIAAFFALLMVDFNKPQAPLDLSQIAIKLPYETIVDGPFGASNKRFGYEHGLTLTIDLPEATVTSGAQLSFNAAGLNIGGELKLELNGQRVYTSGIEPACVKSFCSQSVIVPGNATGGATPLKTGVNVLHFVHAEPTSSWFISDLLFTATPSISAVEREQVGRWLAVAERTYSERDINPGNLVTARAELKRTLDFLARRSGAVELAAQAGALQRETNSAFDTMTADLWAKVNVAVKLERYGEAEGLLQILMRLYPDTASQEYRRIEAQLKFIKERKT